MSTQPITGYRQLSEAEIAFINKVKAHAEQTKALIDELHQFNSSRFATTPGGAPVHPGTLAAELGDSNRWAALAKSQLQQGFMALNRAVALPTTF